MSSAVNALIPQLANYNPAGFALGNQKTAGEIGLNAAQQARVQQETALQQQQTQQEAIKNQLMQQSLQDNRIVMNNYAKHANEDSGYWTDPESQSKFEQELIKSGVSAPGLNGYRDQRLKWMQGLQTFNEGQLKMEETLNGRTADILQNYKDIPDAQKPQIWAQVTAPALNGLHRGQFDPTNPLVGTALDSVIGATAHHKGLLDQQKTVAETAQAQQATAASRTTQAETEAKIPGTQAESKIKEAEAAALNMDPAAIQKMVQGSIDPGKYPDQYQRTLNDAGNAVHLGLGSKGVQAAIKDGSDRIAQRENAISQAQITSIPFREANLENRRYQQLQQSYRFNAEELDKLAQPEMQLAQRIQRLNDTIAQNSPQADALIAPELLSVMSGGQGSGLRMNQAEINQIIGGRSHWQSLEAAINKWSLDPSKANSITPEQRQQIHSLVDVVTARAQQRQQIVTGARSALAGATGPEQHKAIVADAQNKLTQAITAPSTGNVPAVGTISKGYRFKGGDPSKQENWEKQ